MERKYILLLLASVALSAIVAFAVTYAVLVTFGAEYVAKQYASLSLALESTKQSAIQDVYNAGNRSLQSIWTAKAAVEKAMSESIKAEEVPLPVVNQSFEVWLVVKPASECYFWVSNEQTIDITLTVNGKQVLQESYTLPTACSSYEFKVATVNYTGTFGVKEIKLLVHGEKFRIFSEQLMGTPTSPFKWLRIEVNLDRYSNIVTAKTGT